MIMIRRLNYTGRNKIEKKNVTITIAGDNPLEKSLNASFNLGTLNLPNDGRVFVEAYYRMTQSQRFYFGFVNQIKQPEDTTLGSMGLLDDLKFRVFVVDKKGKILALVEDINIEKKIHKKSLLPVEVVELDNMLWKISMIDYEGAPVLQLNKRVSGIRNVAAKDLRFIHSVYPAVVRYIFMYLAFIEKIDFSDPYYEWATNWVRFAQKISTAPPKGTVDDASVCEEIKDWIENVVVAFSNNRRRDWSSNRLREWEL
jgi:hypothetical protein